MAQHENKQCPRCRDTFECKCGSIELCQCSSVSLMEEHHDYIRSLYDDCLCASCLVELRRKYNIEMYETRINALMTR